MTAEVFLFGGVTLPRKPKKPCCFPGCPNLTEDKYCDDHRDFDISTYQRDPNIAKRYGARWRKLRNLYISQHPFCELCAEQGKLVPANEVHHKLPLSHGGTHDPTNLQSLCATCHRKLTASEGDRWRVRRYDYDRG